MTTDTVLTDEELRSLQGRHLNTIGPRQVQIDSAIKAGRAIEQAVLQSDEVQAMRKDAERYRSWRTATVNENTAWLEADIDYQVKNFANPEKPTADEFVAAIDAAMEKQP